MQDSFHQQYYFPCTCGLPIPNDPWDWYYLLIYPQNQPFMQANIQYMGSWRKTEEELPVFNRTHAQHLRLDTKTAGLKDQWLVDGLTYLWIRYIVFFHPLTSTYILTVYILTSNGTSSDRSYFGRVSTFSTSTVLFTSSWTLQPWDAGSHFVVGKNGQGPSFENHQHTPLVPKKCFFPYPFWFRSPTEHRLLSFWNRNPWRIMPVSNLLITHGSYLSPK